VTEAGPDTPLAPIPRVAVPDTSRHPAPLASKPLSSPGVGLDDYLIAYGSRIFGAVGKAAGATGGPMLEKLVYGFVHRLVGHWETTVAGAAVAKVWHDAAPNLATMWHALAPQTPTPDFHALGGAVLAMAVGAIMPTWGKAILAAPSERPAAAPPGGPTN